MKKYIIILFLLSFSLFLKGQSYNPKLLQIAKPVKGNEWVKFRQKKGLSAEMIFTSCKEAFGLGMNDAMNLKKKEVDKIGYSHYRYQQYYKGIPVRGAEYVIHELNGKAITGNGKLVEGININVSPVISAKQAIADAIDYTGASAYIWQSKREEAILKYAKNDPSATYYPAPELMIVDKKCSGIASNYSLVYRIDIYASKPLSRNFVFVNALTGEILFTENRLMTTDVQGIAVTKYTGKQTIWTDSVSPGLYRLRNKHYGKGIETYNMKKGTDYSLAVDFTDNNNIWDTVDVNQDEVATDAHFAAEMTYQFYYKKFGRVSYDNDSAKLLSYVHYDNAYDNAFWDGTRMSYGDGDGTQYGPFTCLDIGGHEITHAVDQYSANLIYQDESGAMNEAFSDIFGTCIEFFADSAHANWLEGDDIDLVNHTGLRNLSNPKADQLPDTYKGQYWVTNSVVDNGGVHTNMGPLSYWFYLMSAGGAGTNDNGQVYNVSGLGIDSAAAIAYRMLTVYLVSSSVYADARIAALQSAEDLYGACSNPVIQVSNAMYAIGIGFPIDNNDLQFLDITSPATACGFTNAEYISARIQYNGCSLDIPAGDTIPVAYRVDGGAIVQDSVILANVLHGGDTLDFIFSTTADFSAIGTHSIDTWVKFSKDTQAANDSLIGYTFQSKIKQNTDVGVSKINGPLSSCHLSNAELVNVDVAFYGCDSLAAGDTMVLAYRINGGNAVRDTFKIPHSIMPSDTFNHIFTKPADLSAPGIYTIDAWTEFKPDTMNTNDMFSGYVVHHPTGLGFDTVTFEESNINNIMLTETTHYSHAFISAKARHTGTKGLQMTGGNAIDYINILQFPDGVNTWNINDFLSAKANFCVDATSWTNAYMRFDLKQTDGGALYTLLLGPGDYTKASNLRILVNNAQIGGTYNPVSYSSDAWASHNIDLSAYAGQQFTVTFETRNIAEDTLIYTLDNAYIDNVIFSPYPLGIEEYGQSLNAGVYPNPFNDQFTVAFSADKQETASLEVMDITGRSVIHRTWQVTMGTNSINLDLGDQPAGVYIVKLFTAKGFVAKQIVKM